MEEAWRDTIEETIEGYGGGVVGYHRGDNRTCRIHEEGPQEELKWDVEQTMKETMEKT